MHEPASVLPSDDPSAFARARRRVPLAAIEATFREAATAVVGLAGDDRLWCDRRVVVVDGSNVSMPDTPELQAAFPQHGQKPGCGFPVMHLAAQFCWTTGALLDIRMGSQHDSELTMFREMFDQFGSGDVILADRFYCSYCDIVRLSQRGADVVLRMHHRRRSDFREGARLGPDDRLVIWTRPKQWLASFGLTREQFETLPATMTLRMLRTTRVPKGFRSKKIVLVTTILDPLEATTEELLALYRDRWMAELNLRSIKTTLGMEVLRGKSVDVVRKELLVHATLYNLIRMLMWEAARASGRDVRRMSFAGTLHRLQRIGPSLFRASLNATDLLAAVLACVSTDIVPDRPGRMEPRRVKRRPKNYSRLTKPRTFYHRCGDSQCR
jgi:hypothetical protein